MPLNYFQPIIERSLFGSPDKPPENVKAKEIEALQPTSLKVALLGTVTGDQKSALAVIEETDKRTQGLYRIGDSVQSAMVKMILRGKVVLRVNEKDEILTMEESAKRAKTPRDRRAPRAGPRRSGSKITLNRSDLQESLTDINKLLTQVRIRPHFKDGQPDGLAVTRIKPGSIFSRLGLRNGDVVREVNGKPIRSPDDIFSLYEDFKSGSEVSVEISRRGRQRSLSYNFK
jgi:general secretion pathway protein C